MSLRLVIVAALTASQTGVDAGALARCAAIKADPARLACYDTLTRSTVDHVFAGHGSGRTPVFEIKKPSILYFSSEDVILLVDFMRPSGEIVQNLHLGGRGTGTYAVQKPGHYVLEVNASGRWHIWVLAQSESDLAAPVP